MRRVENGPYELIVFDPKKIKSINNNGTWDKNNDNIYQ